MEQDKCPICKSKLQYKGQVDVESYKTITATIKEKEGQGTEYWKLF